MPRSNLEITSTAVRVIRDHLPGYGPVAAAAGRSVCSFGSAVTVRLRQIVAFVGAALVVGACSHGTLQSGPEPTAAEVGDLARPLISDGSTSFDYRYYFDSVASLAKTVPDVVVGTITGDRRKQATHLPDESSAIRVLSVKVEKSVKDKLPSGTTIEVETPGWVAFDGQPERQLSDAAGLRLLIGDRVVLGLARENAAPTAPRGLAFGAAAFVLEEGQVVDTGRADMLAKEAESMTEQQLLQALGASA